MLVLAGGRLKMHGVLLDIAPAGPSQWTFVVIGLLGLIYLAFVRPLKKGRKKDPLARSPLQSSLAQQRAMERDMTTLLVEYEQMMRRMTSQLETRVAKIEVLLADADDRIEQLTRLSADSKSLTQPNPKVAAAVQAARSPAAIPFDSPLADVTQPKGRPTPVAVVPASHQMIYDLADQGLDRHQIARRLDRPVGEIELILALRERAAAAHENPSDQEKADRYVPVQHETTDNDDTAGDDDDEESDEGEAPTYREHAASDPEDIVDDDVPDVAQPIAGGQPASAPEGDLALKLQLEAAAKAADRVETPHHRPRKSAKHRRRGR